MLALRKQYSEYIGTECHQKPFSVGAVASFSHFAGCD